MITTLQKDGFYMQSIGPRKWLIKNPSIPESLPGRNVGIKIEEEGVVYACIADKIIQEPTNGFARIDFKKLKMFSDSSEVFSETEFKIHYISSTVYVNAQGETVPDAEAFEENRQLKEGYTNDYDFFDNLINKSTSIVTDVAMRDFIEKIFVTIPNAKNA